MSDTPPQGNDAPGSTPADSSPAQSQAPAEPAPVAPAAPAGWPVTYPMAYQAAAAQAAAPPSAPPPVEPPPAAPQATMVPAPYPQGSQTSSSAVVALVLAIASWAVCPLVLAIIALVFASKADREIDASGGRIQGGGLTTAAKIVSWINIGVFVAFLVVTIFIVIIAVIAGGLSQVTPIGQV